MSALVRRHASTKDSFKRFGSYRPCLHSNGVGESIAARLDKYEDFE